MAPIYEQIVDAMNELHGVHPGYRAVHAKGVFCRGTFTATPQARELTHAAHMQGEPVQVSVRFSNGSGNPEDPDADRRDGRGMAVGFQLPDGATTDIVAITLPVFFVRSADDFLEFLRVRRPDPDTGEMDMERVGAFLAAHPDTQAAVELILPSLAPPASYAECAYNGLHAFGFSNQAGQRRFGRYHWEPEAGVRMLSDEEIESASPNYLREELSERLAAGSVGFTLSVKLAEGGDPLEDPTVPWPDDRRTITLGEMELTGLDTDSESDDEIVVFDPTHLTDGIECSDDEILATRTRAYTVSAERRSKVRSGAQPNVNA